MPVRLDITLLSGRYDAGGEDPRQTEWPPHPARVFAALRAVAGDDDLGALALLERLDPPRIHASAAGQRHARAYVVTNAVVTDKRSLKSATQARTNAWKQRVSSLPHSCRVQFDWADGDVDDETLQQLDRLARRVPYLGRSTSPAVLIFSRVRDPEPLPGLTTYEPAGPGPGTCTIRVPYPGYLEELRALYEVDQPAWQAADARSRRTYRKAQPVVEEPPPEPVESAYPDLVIIRFVGQRPPGNLVARFTQALRHKVMSQTAEPLPPALHGHGLPGVPHVAYLGLPFSGYEHADGQLIALAIAIPGLDRAERRRILRGLLGADPTRNVQLYVPGVPGTFELQYAPDDPLPRSATVERWVRPSRTWVSVTPLVLDRFPKDGDVERAAAACLVQAGLPAPREITVSRQPLTQAAVQLTPKQLPRRCRGRLFRHVRVAFDRPVRGPLLAGAGRYFGVGLFAPEHEEGQR